VKRKTLQERAIKYGYNWRNSVMDKASIAEFAWLAGYRAAKRQSPTGSGD
jgi:hypothetical protein